MTIQAKNKKKPIGEPFVVSTAPDDTDLSQFDFSDVDKITEPIIKEAQRKAEEDTNNALQKASSIKSEIDEITKWDFSDVDSTVQSIGSIIPNSSESSDDDFDFTDVDSILSESVEDLGEPIRFATNPNLKTEIPIEYDEGENLSPEEKLVVLGRIKPTAKNPYTLLKTRTVELSTVKMKSEAGNDVPIPANESVRPNNNEIIDAALGQIDNELINARKRYREETGRELIILDKTPEMKFENGKWIANVALTEASARTINAYARGGLSEAKEEARKINNETIVYTREYNDIKSKMDAYAKERPYLTAIESGISDAGIRYTQLSHNIRKISDAIYIGARYGLHSPEFDKLIEEDKKEQSALNQLPSQVQNVEGIGPNITRAITGVAGDLPKMLAAGQGLPLLVFLENSHRGSDEAARDAFFTIPMIGVGKAMGEVTAESVRQANFSLASRAMRQAEVRFGQGATNILSEFVSNPSIYLNGDKPFDVVQNINQQRSVFREGAGTQAVSSFVTGAAFPTGKVQQDLPLSLNIEDIGTEKLLLPPATIDIPFRQENEVVFSEAEKGIWKGNWDDVVLNYLTLKQNKEAGNYRTGDLQQDVDRLSNINRNLETLEEILPKEWIDFVSQNESTIREAKAGGQRRREFKEEVRQRREKGEVTEEVEKLSTFDVADWAKEGHSVFGEVGKDNKTVTQDKSARDITAAKVSFQQQSSIEGKRVGGQGGNIPLTSKKVGEDRVSYKWYNENKTRLGRIGAFYIEAGIKDFSEFSNRLQNDLGSEIFDRLGDKRVREVFESGQKFYETNIAEPFFSGFKQNVVERFPDGNMNANSAKNLIEKLGTKNEIEWTSGLREWIDSRVREEKKINKNELVKFVEENQVKVDEIVLGQSTKERLGGNWKLESEEQGIRFWRNLDTDDIVSRTDDLNPADSIVEEVSSATRYDLKTYTSERLELEGGENPREVLLQIPTSRINNLPEGYRVEEFVDYNGNKKYQVRDANGKLLSGLARMSEQEAIEATLQSLNKGDNYSHPHWSSYENVVSHFRANSRSTIDGKNVFHSEEFQSDWNQAGRKEGYKEELIKNEIDLFSRGYYLVEDPSASNHGFWIEDSTGNPIDGGITRQEAINSTIQTLNEQFRQGPPKNPFMENNWKELTFKRFLRMGVEMRKDGVTWTTSEQQQERYYKTLQTKDISYRKNKDNTFDLSIKIENKWRTFDELRGLNENGLTDIVGREFAEKIIANTGDRNIDNYRVTKSPQRDFVIEDITTNEYYTIGTGDIARFETASAAQNFLGSKQFKSKSGVVSGKDIKVVLSKFSDYDTYFPNLAKKIGKRFGAKYEMKSVETSGKEPEEYKLFTNDEIAEAFNNGASVYNKTKGKLYNTHQEIDATYDLMNGDHIAMEVYEKSKIESVHFLEITPQMRESLKQGFPLYGIGLEDLPTSQRKTGIRNTIFPREEYNQNLRGIVESLDTLVEGDSGTVLNSGLNPSAFAYQARLLYKGFQDIVSFTEQLVRDYGEAIKPHAEKLWNFIKEFDNLLDASWREIFGRENDIPSDKVLMHISGISGSGKTELMNKLREEVKNVKLIDLDEFDDKAVAKLGWTGKDKNDYTDEMLTTLFNTRQQLIDDFVSISKKPIIFFGIHEEGGKVTNVHTTNTSYLNVSPERAVTRQFIRADKILGKQARDDFNERLEIANKDIEFLDEQGYAAKSPREIFNEIKTLAENLPPSSEAGFLRLSGREKEIKEGMRKARSEFGKNLVYSAARSITLAQINPHFRSIYEGMRDIRLMLNGYSSVLIQQMHTARTLSGYRRLLHAADPNVPVAIYKGNEESKVYTDAELSSRFGLNADTIDAYRKIRQAQDDILNLRMKQELYHDYRALGKLTPNSPEWNKIQANIQKTQQRYDALKKSGYISLQRQGNIAIFAEDTAYPVGDPKRQIYVHAKNWREANNIVKDFKRQKFSNIESKKLIKLQDDMNYMRRLTPGQIEDLIASSGSNRNDPEIKKVIDEVYSRYASYGYNINRSFVRGYKTTWKNMLDTMIHQANTYSSSFYSDIARENALDMLNTSGIQSTDPVTYNAAKSYIEDETTPSSRGILGANERLSQFRTLTYITQMGLDVSQFFLNLTQPIILTYPHLAKTEQTGLKGLQPEKIFLQAMPAVGKLLAYEKRLSSARNIGLTPKSNLPKDMTDFFGRAIDEDVIKAELTTSYAASQLGTGTSLQKVADWSSMFARAGEHVTRTHAFAAAYYTGKNKNLSGNSLYNFIVDTIKQTHGESSYGEAPRIIREMGEFGRLFYQFGSFNQMWWENLATAMKSDVNTKSFKGLAGGSSVRQMGALYFVGGLTGLPLASGLRAFFALYNGRDRARQWENEIEEELEENVSKENAEIIKNLALYGISGRRGISSRLGMRVPLLDSAVDTFTTDVTALDSFPAIATAKQIANAPKDFLRHEGFRFAEDLSPRAARNIIRGFRFNRWGVRERREFGEGVGDVIVPKGRLSRIDIALQGVGVTPTSVVNKYEQKKYKMLGEIGKKGKRSLRRYLNF